MPRGTGFPARGFGTGPPVLRPPSSVLRFFRLLRFFAANPPSSVLSHLPSVLRPQPSALRLSPVSSALRLLPDRVRSYT